MKNFKAKLAQFKKDGKGAACFFAPATGKTHCGNQLTHQEAIAFAKAQGLKLLDWQQGKSCSEVDCNALG
jgi:hypothetical protein